MRSGLLNRKITIEEKGAGSPRQDAAGERADAWTTFATVRAGIRPISGRERRSAEQAQGQIDTEIEIRYLAGVLAGMRVSHLGVHYAIRAVLNPKLENVRLLLQCVAGVRND